MPAYRPVGEFLLGLGLVWLALGLRLGLLGLTQGLALGPLLLVLGPLLLALGLLGVALLTRPTPPSAMDRRGRSVFSVFPTSLREEWGGDLAEARWQWHQCGYAQWSIRLWTLGWMLQLVETRMRCTLYAMLWAHRWKKP